MQIMCDKAWKFCLRNGFGIWGEDPKYPKADWVYDATNNNTVRGYWDWVICQIEQEEDEGG